MKRLLFLSVSLAWAFLAGGQNVGIGTLEPVYPVQLARPGAGYGFVHSALGVEVGTYIDANGGWLGTNSNHPLLFYTNNGLYQMQLTQAGALAIGGGMPAKRLHVFGDLQIGTTAVWTSPADNTMINFGDLDFCYIGERGADDRLELRAGSFYFSNGYVGIGTPTPSSALDVSGTVRTTNFQMTAGAGANKVLRSNESGFASWVNDTHFVGESFGGGIVFYTYDGGRHGLIAAPVDQGTDLQWTQGPFTVTNAVRDGTFAGLCNTERIILSEDPEDVMAAQTCAAYQGGGFGDWYLPSQAELNLLYLQQAAVGGFSADEYWSSREYDVYAAWYQNFGAGNQGHGSKAGMKSVRAIRAF